MKAEIESPQGQKAGYSNTSRNLLVTTKKAAESKVKKKMDKSEDRKEKKRELR